MSGDGVEMKRHYSNANVIPGSFYDFRDAGPADHM